MPGRRRPDFISGFAESPMGTMQEFEQTSTLYGSNAPFIEELYET